MIGFLSGIVREILPRTIILDCTGVGYEIFATNNALAGCVKKGPLELYIHTHVREDQLTLFGFSSLAERTLFLQLLSVSGVGPKTAMEVLNQPMDLIKGAIMNEDAILLSKTPGLGKKTAEKIIIELKGKIESDFGEGRIAGRLEMTVREEVIAALEGLGYRRAHVLRLLGDVPDDLVTSEEIVKFFLQRV